MKKYIKEYYLQPANLNQRRCVVEGCNIIVYAKGLCRKHYMRFLRTGDVKLKVYPTYLSTSPLKAITPITKPSTVVASKPIPQKVITSINRNSPVVAKPIAVARPIAIDETKRLKFKELQKTNNIHNIKSSTEKKVFITGNHFKPKLAN